MIALDAIGIDLTAFAVFSGAVGVGIGFGLQAIFSNMVSGIIMLFERSVKVGDFVDLQSGVTGEVKEINIRSTLVTTNDNIDVLVPNSEFINGRVTNWTLRDEHKRLRIPFGVAYGSNKEQVRKAALEAANEVPHTLLDEPDRQPQVWLVNYGDSSLDFELVVWLKPEAVRRPAAVQAAYNWEIETKLHKYSIEIPFPQRDLHLRTGKLPIQLVGRD
jgi:small-conductance mechanosensitive channel